MSIRTARVNEEIRKVLSERLVRGLRDPLPGFVTIAAVEVTSDFSHAKVWVSVIGTETEKTSAVAVLQANRGSLRGEVGRSVRLRQTPELHFLLDEAGERAARVWQLLEDEKRKAAGGSPGPSAGAPEVVAPPVELPGRPPARTRGAGERGPARGGASSSRTAGRPPGRGAGPAARPTGRGRGRR